MPSFRFYLCLAMLAVTLLSTKPVYADRVGRLIQILTSSPNYKIRLQAVITLGTLKSKRAVPALIRALADENASIRGVAAAALGQIEDQRALPDLKQLLRKEKNSLVRHQVERAIKSLSAVPTRRETPSRGRYYIAMGKLINKSNRNGMQFSRFLSEALLKEFSQVKGIVTTWESGKQPGATELQRSGFQGFIIDGAILSLTSKSAAQNVEISCSIKVSLSTYPGNSLKAFYSGGASTEIPARSLKPEFEERLFKEVLEGAAQGAKQHIVQNFLHLQ